MEQDWAELKKYQRENEVIFKNKHWPKVVFMGNSITEGWMELHPEFFLENEFVNRGIGGQTTPQMLIRFTPDVIDLKPRAVVILAGTNDIAGNTGYSTIKSITDNMKAMAQLARQNSIKVIFCSVLPVEEYPWNPGTDPVPEIRELNAWLERYASENDHTYVDLFMPMANRNRGIKEVYSEDGVHPNLQAYKKMEPILKKVIITSLHK